jgi:hypothetical protein
MCVFNHQFFSFFCKFKFKKKYFWGNYDSPKVEFFFCIYSILCEGLNGICIAVLVTQKFIWLSYRQNSKEFEIINFLSNSKSWPESLLVEHNFSLFT